MIIGSFFVVFCLIAFALAGPRQFSGPLKSAYSSQRAENHVNKIKLPQKVEGYQISKKCSLNDLCNPKKKAFCVLLFLPPLGTCNATCRLMWLLKMLEAQKTEEGDGLGVVGLSTGVFVYISQIWFHQLDTRAAPSWVMWVHPLGVPHRRQLESSSFRNIHGVPFYF